MSFFQSAFAATALLFASVTPALAVTEFVPPNDMTGRVWSTNSNDGWINARGIGFTVTGDVVIESVGVFQDLNGVALTYTVSEITALSGTFSRTSMLASGGSTVTTSGLEWIDYAIAPITLSAGTNYSIEFSFQGSSNQNFFYNNDNVAWTQGLFTGLEGTLGSSFSNFVVGAFRVDADTVTAPVPVPGALPLMAAGMAGFAAVRRRKKAA
ncbi:MAG: PEP-CTERM sorting domain-containing protein [Parvularculaceae bacterium]|nr:PEP-CTERM sorting domain-containing protein [Parvularculaceae bacterium]